ncbi:HNH endonuclease family protein [Nocardioides sp.]|uniref:HNH endonuclease family protein n=1 Tax=Nocardioides sp. TaxID=35761 RepID=UPI003D114CD6
MTPPSVARFALVGVLALAGVGAIIPSAQARAPHTVSVTVRAAVRNLPVATEHRKGYDRDKFADWFDADGDCRDTRDEVLAAESLVAVRGCDIQRGKWRSYYDGVVTRESTTFDIDHLVPLAEVWDSGGRRWTADTRDRYANDLGDRRTLVAVSASSNRSKGDQDPAEWMPELARCTYVRQWVAVKIRWHLSVDKTEKAKLTAMARACANLTITVRTAKVGRRG